MIKKQSSVFDVYGDREVASMMLLPITESDNLWMPLMTCILVVEEDAE